MQVDLTKDQHVKIRMHLTNLKLEMKLLERSDIYLISIMLIRVWLTVVNQGVCLYICVCIFSLMIRKKIQLFLFPQCYFITFITIHLIIYGFVF